MRIGHLLVWLVLTGASARQGAPSTQRPVTRPQFRRLAWLIGRWRGSGRFVPPFYEQYRFRDDSTISMTAYTDSTFQTETADSSVIELRDGRVRSRTPRAIYEVLEFSPTSVRFRRIGALDGGHRFEHISRDEWRATLFPRGASADTTVLQLRRAPMTQR